MRSGWFGGSICFALLLSVLSFGGVGETLFVNGEPFETDLPLLSEAGTVLAPLFGFDHAIGLEAEAIDGGARISLRWDQGRRMLSRHDLPVRDGEVYVSVDVIVGLVGGSVHRIADAIYVETRVASLDDLDVADGRVILRFDGFVPDLVMNGSGEELRVRFSHCEPNVSARSILMAEGNIADVRLLSTAGHAVDLVIRLREPAALDIQRQLSEGFFSVSLGFAEVARRETITRLAEDQSLREAETLLSGGLTRVQSVTIDEWRDAYRLSPAVATAGIGATGSILQMAAAQGACVAVDAGTAVGLCIIDGIPVCLEDVEGPALCVDLFGRLTLGEQAFELQLSTAGVRIPVDDANRPIAYGEVLAYTPGYLGEIARGVPGTFTVVKLRQGRVVSIYNGGFVFEDSTATLIVASGEARARLSSLSLGMQVELQSVGVDGRPILDALSVGPILSDEGMTMEETVWGDIDPDLSLAWSVLVTDWHGGLTLLSVVRDASSAGATASEVVDLLRGLSVPVRDAVVLNCGATSSLVVSDADGLHELSGEGGFPVGLCLIPTTE